MDNEKIFVVKIWCTGAILYSLIIYLVTVIHLLKSSISFSGLEFFAKGLVLTFSAIGIFQRKRWGLYITFIYIAYGTVFKIYDLFEFYKPGSQLKNVTTSSHYTFWLLILLIFGIYFFKERKKFNQ